MDAKGSFLASFSLLLLLCFQHTRAHPVDSLSPAKELASMEELLERLEEKFSLMEGLPSNPELEELETQRGRMAEPSDISENQQSETQVESGPFPSDRSSLLKRMRGLQAPKNLQGSGCFGRRLDRIGSVSGMGCKGARRY
ncbi:natriuretic peptides A-like [Hemicordylus capensis]|uniref:natriuretic peptides A-like n=1 Tax=Hemicordylus capensis TaxID=884348 RepID=UPI002302414E|nr:natriuretic peptides A-like [Hemicordylus capensis]